MSGTVAFGIFFIVVFYTIRRTRRLNSKKPKYDSRGHLIIPKNSTGPKVSLELDQIIRTLEYRFPSFTLMTENERKKISSRTYIIHQSKEFYGMEEFNLTREHEIVISATLAKLTLGLGNRFELPSFEMIQIYPQTFYSKLIEKHVNGLTLGNGRIFLSWKHFENGMANESDKIHVGLHEFAHALMIEFDHFNYLPQWKTWMSIAQPIMLEVRSSSLHFFRQYGGTNIQEFWAVTIETFFEQPFEFRAQYPRLYNATVAMLNQDPCARQEIFDAN